VCFFRWKSVCIASLFVYNRNVSCISGACKESGQFLEKGRTISGAVCENVSFILSVYFALLFFGASKFSSTMRHGIYWDISRYGRLRSFVTLTCLISKIGYFPPKQCTI